MTHKFFEVIINLHDGEGAGTAQGTSGENSGENGTSTGGGHNEISSEVRQRGQQLGLSDDLLADYQKAFGKKSDNEQQTTQEQDNTNDEKEDFKSLIKGKYRSEFDNEVQTMFKDRFAKQNQQMSEMQAQIANANKILDIVALKYPNIDVNDRDALFKAVSNDNDVFGQRALDSGVTVEEAKRQWAEELEKKQTQDELDMLRREKAIRELDAKLQSLAIQTKQIYPDFDLQTEMNNPDFQAALDFIAQRNSQKNKETGKNDEIFNLTKAYEMTHHDEITANTINKVGNAAMNAFAQNIAVNGNRFRENANVSTSAKPKAKSVRDMSDKEFDALLRNVKNGTARIPR